MNGRMVILHAKGGETTKDYTDTVPLADLQAAVGGYIQLVPGFRKFRGQYCVAFCNEEGKLHGMEVNMEATISWWKGSGHGGDALVGDVAILTGDDDFMEAL